MNHELGWSAANRGVMRNLVRRLRRWWEAWMFQRSINRMIRES